MINNPKVFISYAKQDTAVAEDIYQFLLTVGCRPWMDMHNLLPGQDWRLEIETAIEESDFFLACISNTSVSKKGFVQKELKIGFSVLETMPEGTIFLIPVRLDECPVPRSLSSRHWLDWTSPDAKRNLAKTLSIEKSMWEAGLGNKLEFEAATRLGEKLSRIDVKLLDTVQGRTILAEYKSTNWDSVKLDRIRPTARRHARQIWRHIGAGYQGKPVLPVIVYPLAPQEQMRKELVERVLSDQLVQVIWKGEVKDD